MAKTDAYLFAATATRRLQDAGHRIKVRYDGGGWYRWKRLDRSSTDPTAIRRARVEELMRLWLEKGDTA